MAAKVGSSISDLGQSLFHNVDKMSSRLVGDETFASFFAEQSASKDGIPRLGVPPTSLPMSRASTYASTSTDGYDEDSDLESVDDDKTVRADNKTSTRQERRIARLREDKRVIERKREKISRRSDVIGAGAYTADGMPEVSPSTLSTTPPRYRDRQAKTSRRPNQNSRKREESLQTEGLPQIPELRRANVLVDGLDSDDDKDVLRNLAFAPLPTTENKKDEKSVTWIDDIPLGPVERKDEDANNGCHDSDTSYGDSTSSIKRNKKRRCRLSKISIAAILLIACGFVLILVSTLRRRANNLRGETSSASSTSSENDSISSQITSTGTRVPTASPSKLPTDWAVPGLPLDYTASPTSLPTSKPTDLLLETSGGDLDAEESFSFYVMSQNPELSKTQFKSIDDGEFFIHLGGIFSADDQDCKEEAYDDAADLLRKSKLPVLVIPANKDWVDCTNIKPKKAIRLWKNSFVGIEKTWKEESNIPGLVERSDDFPETFAFLFRGTLFIGMNSGRDEADKDKDKLREKETEQFIKAQVKAYEDEPSLRSIIAFAHSYRFDDVLDWVSQRLDGNVQVVLVHGDETPNNKINSFIDMPMEAVPPTKLTVLNGRLLTQ